MTNPFVAVDFGACAIRAMAAYFDDNDKLHVLGYKEEQCSDRLIERGILDGFSVVGMKLNTCLQELAKDVQKQHNIRLAKTNEGNTPYINIFVSVGTKDMALLTNQKGNFTTQKKISQEIIEANKSKLMNLLAGSDALKNKMIYDITIYQLLAENGETYDDISDAFGTISGKYHLRFFALVESKDNNERLRNAIHQSNLAIPTQKIPKPYALAASVLSKQQSAIIIDMGATLTTMIMFAGGRPTMLTTVPLGGNDITEKLASSLDISHELAEKLKQNYTNLQYLSQDNVRLNILPSQQQKAVQTDLDSINRVIVECMDIMFKDIKEQINNFTNQQKRINAAQPTIILTGGGSEINGIREYLNQLTGLHVLYGDHKNWLAPDTDANFFAPRYATLIGTCIYAKEFVGSNDNEEQTPKKDPHKAEGGGFSGFLSSFFNSMKNRLDSVDDIEPRPTDNSKPQEPKRREGGKKNSLLDDTF